MSNTDQNNSVMDTVIELTKLAISKDNQFVTDHAGATQTVRFMEIIKKGLEDLIAGKSTQDAE